MVVISVIGAPSVGKSFLVKQLACLNCKPAFFEGEKGVFPQEVLKLLNAEKDSEERFEWILSRYKETLERAHKISKNGIDCYVDGDILSVEAWLKAEVGDKSPAVLKRWLEENNHLRVDKVIILTLPEDKIKDNLVERGRESEQSDFIYERALRIQKACEDIAEDNDNVFLVEREDIDFTKGKDLQWIDKNIKKM